MFWVFGSVGLEAAVAWRAHPWSGRRVAGSSGVAGAFGFGKAAQDAVRFGGGEGAAAGECGTSSRAGPTFADWHTHSVEPNDTGGEACPGVICVNDSLGAVSQ